MMLVVFEETPEGLYDLKIDRRTREHDIEPTELGAALRRARVPKDVDVFVEDLTGWREKQRMTR